MLDRLVITFELSKRIKYKRKEKKPKKPISLGSRKETIKPLGLYLPSTEGKKHL
jgi:hypothetical protein